MRLGLALVLTIVVINQAGKPEFYEPFFANQPPARLVAKPLATNSAVATTIAKSLVNTQSLTQTVALLTAAQRDQLTDYLATTRRDAVPSSDKSQAALATIIAANASLAGESIDLLAESNLLADATTLARLQTALDKTYLDSIDDGSIWRKGDELAFYRLLENSDWIDRDGAIAPQVGVVNLLQQSDSYLGKAVAMRGRIARATRRRASVNPFGVEHYYELWLQPRDGSERPVAFYSRQVPDDVAAFDGQDFVADGPLVDLHGVFLKRLAFRSQGGAEVAPAIVGELILPAPITANTIVNEADWQPNLAMLLAIAAAVGFSVAAAIMLANRVTARRLARLRQSHRPPGDALFQSLQTLPPPRETE